jgi:AraC-like DNA-binding protein
MMSGLVPKQRISCPDAFNAAVATASRGGHVGPLKRRPFSIELTLALLPRTALFMVEPTNTWAARPATGDFRSLTIPVRGGFSGSKRRHDFEKGEIYFIDKDRDFHFEAPTACQALVVNILSDDLNQKADVLAGARSGEFAEIISTASPAGGALDRFAHFFWAELQNSGGVTQSPKALAELEDCLVSLVALAGTESGEDKCAPLRLGAMRRAEEYLIQHLTSPVIRSDLARAARVSIRSVSRGFRERHGMGPIAWLRERRLDSAQRELQRAAPGELTVTEVAVRYGFENAGRFAAQYRRRFGETPSQTLRS